MRIQYQGMPSERYIRSLRLHEQAARLVPGASQTMSKRIEPGLVGRYPAFLSRGEGCRVWDVDGNEYIDFLQALGPVVLGYRHSAVDAAIRESLEQSIVFGLPHPLETEAARALVEVVPCAEQVRFLKSGAEATSAAARIARGFTGRRTILQCGYHGWHDQWSVHRNDGGIPESLAPYTVPFPYNRLDSLERLLAERRGDVAAVMMVPTQVEAPAPGYLEQVAALARREGALLVFDEIVTGFRMAPGGAQEYYGVTPDLACFAKAMANGMPLAAIAGRAEVMRRVETLVISTTYGGEILSLAAALATLRVMREERVHERLWQLGERLMAGVNRVAAAAGVAAEMTGHAPMAQLRFDEPDPARLDRLWTSFIAACAERGVLTGRGRLWFIVYAHTVREIDRAVEVCAAALAEAKRAS